MRVLMALIPLALASGWAQTAKPAAVTTPVAAAPAGSPKIARQTFIGLEKSFDDRLGKVGGPEHPAEVLGMTRGLYLEDYGVVFTAEVSLIVTPVPTPFRPVISPELRANVHKWKLDNLPALRQAMREMVKGTALTMNAAGVQLGVLKPTSQVVLAIRLLYIPYEDTINLPSLIIMKADLKGALADNIKVEEQF